MKHILNSCHEGACFAIVDMYHIFFGTNLVGGFRRQQVYSFSAMQKEKTGIVVVTSWIFLLTLTLDLLLIASVLFLPSDMMRPSPVQSASHSAEIPVNIVMDASVAVQSLFRASLFICYEKYNTCSAHKQEHRVAG